MRHLLILTTLSVSTALFGAACTGPTARSGPEDAAPAEASTTGWVTELARVPDTFSRLTATDRAGWIALHAGALDTAVLSFPEGSTGRTRAHLHRLGVRQDLAAVVDAAIVQTLTLWRARGLSTDDGVAVIGPLWRTCAVPSVTDAPAPPQDPPLPDWAIARVNNTDVSLAPIPMHETASRKVWDPCLLRNLVRIDEVAVAEGTGRLRASAGGLEARVFAPWRTQEDLLAESSRTNDPARWGALSPSLPAPEGFDLAQGAAGVAALDTALDAERLHIAAEAPDAGASLLIELGLYERLRQEVLVARAREALAAGHPNAAVALADTAWDAATHDVGPQNHPEVASVRARALIAAGRTREALDALEILRTAVPEAVLAREWVADLAVLESMDRDGTSRE